MTCPIRRLLPWAGLIAATVLAQPAAHGIARIAPRAAPQSRNFSSGVELIAIDVGVVDKAGNPIRSLRLDQFEVTVDGRPRRVVKAELVDHAAVSAAPETGGREVSRAAYSSNEAAGRSAAPGRLVFILIDQGSFRPTAAAAAAAAAERFVRRLQPHDRVGLIAFPLPGPSIAPSRDRASLLDGLRRVTGSAEPLRASLGPSSMSLSQALDIEAGDINAQRRVVDRVCAGSTGMSLSACVEDVRSEAGDIARRAQVQAVRTLGHLRAVVSGLAKIQERKTLVLIGGGLPIADRFGRGLDARGEISAIAVAAGAANANIYVLHLDSSFLDAFSATARTANDALARDSSVMAAGLESLAAASGGSLLRVLAGADTAFDRVLQETSASYLLALEPAEGDKDGKPHSIGVSVAVPGAQVRHRREFTLPARSAAAVETPDDQVAAALRTGRAATALRVTVSTCTFGKAPLGGLRVLVIANVGRALTAPLEVRVGYVVTDAGGRVAGSVLEKQQLSVSESNAAGSASYVSAVNLEPGDYNIRLAAIDPSGRVGSVDHSFVARLGEGDGFAMGDLLLLHPSAAPGASLSPVVDGRLRGAAVDAHLQVYVRGRGKPPSVSFGIADRADAEPFLETKIAAPKTDAGGHAAVDARLDLGVVPPGDYFVVATLSDGTRRLGRRHVPLRVEAAASVGGGGGSPAVPRVRFHVGESTFVKPFAVIDVLAPDSLTYFLGRLQAADKARVLPAVTAAVAALRAGQFGAALSSLDGAQPGHLSAAFLRGIALLGKGELEPAAGQFREALRIADDFLPAAFYLGACYAAGGRDSEAVGAWQTALITEDEARVVYDVLADALLRLADAGQAVEILTEARGRWPDDVGFLPRLAAAQAMLERWDQALATIDAYVARHEPDADALALGVRVIYEAHVAGGVIRSATADAELAAKYGALYRAAGGPMQPLIDRWVAFIGKG